MTQANDDNSFAKAIYNGINSAIGGTNSNQFITLMLPGIVLNREDYEYDYTDGGTKGAIVEQNESRLANKVFDPCYMTGSDNGFSLPYQYKSALDMLTPQINKSLAEHKTMLRQLLINDYPYDFGDGSDTMLSLQEVYFRLYDEYILELNRWNNIQQNKMEELKEKDPVKYNEAYLQWYETNAQLYLNEIEEKKSKILSVFSPNDMKTLEGVLDSGCGAELQEARQAMLNVRKLTPSGGSVYPVRFNPPDWFNMIGTSFTSADLLDSPEALTEEMQHFSTRRMELFSFVLNTASLIKKSNIVTLYKDALAAKNKLDNAKSYYVKNYGTAIDRVIYSAIDLRQALNNNKRVQQSLLRSLSIKNEPLLSGKIRSVNRVVTNISSKLSNYDSLQKDYIAKMTTLVAALILLPKENNADYAHFNELLGPVIKQLNEINKKIVKLQRKIEISTRFYEEDKTNRLKATDSTLVVPDGFTQIHIKSSLKELNKTMQETSETLTSGLGFLFLGRRNSSSSSSSESSFLNQNCEVEIDMNVAKVAIERDWFNPGIFSLTKDMLKLGKSMISPGEKFTGITQERLNAMQGCVFPCYTVAMIIARDIKISFKFTSTTQIENFYEEVEKHAKFGGSFFIFRGTGSSSSSSASGVHSCMVDDKTVMLKIDTTQLIGYYQEATRPDESKNFESMSQEDRAKQTVQSISDFASTYSNVLAQSERLKRLRLKPAGITIDKKIEQPTAL